MNWKVLMIDDEIEDFHRIRDKAEAFNLIVEYAEDLFTAEGMLYGSPHKYSAIIIDGVGKLKIDAQETDKFAYMAQSLVSGVTRSSKRKIPAIILTGHKALLEHDVNIDFEVYSKLNQEEEALEVLQKKIREIDVLPKAIKYKKAKRIFTLRNIENDLFTESKYNELLKKNLNGSLSEYGILRNYLEYIIKEWWFDYDEVFPWTNRNQFNLGGYMNFLSGYYVPKENKPNYQFKKYDLSYYKEKNKVFDSKRNKRLIGYMFTDRTHVLLSSERGGTILKPLFLLMKSLSDEVNHVGRIEYKIKDSIHSYNNILFGDILFDLFSEFCSWFYEYISELEKKK